MAAFNNSNASAQSGQVNITVGITPGAGTDRFMLAFGHIADTTPGTGTMVIDSDLDGNLTDEYTIQVFDTYSGHKTASLVAPDTGTHVITLNRDAQYAIALSVCTFTAVDQTTPTDTWAFDTGASCAIAVTSATDDMVFAGCVADDNAFGVDAGGDLTQAENDANYGSDGWTIVTGYAAGTTTVNADFDNAAGSYGAGAAAVNINNGAPAAPPITIEVPMGPIR